MGHITYIKNSLHTYEWVTHSTGTNKRGTRGIHKTRGCWHHLYKCHSRACQLYAYHSLSHIKCKRRSLRSVADTHKHTQTTYAYIPCSAAAVVNSARHWRLRHAAADARWLPPGCTLRAAACVIPVEHQRLTQACTELQWSNVRCTHRRRISHTHNVRMHARMRKHARTHARSTHSCHWRKQF